MKGVGGEMMQTVPDRGNCTTHPRSYQQGLVARAGEQEPGQEEMRQGQGLRAKGRIQT